MSAYPDAPYPDMAISLAWIAWIVSWWLAAFWRKRTVKRPPRLQEAAHLVPTLVGAWLLFSTAAAPEDPTRQMFMGRGTSLQIPQLWITPDSLGWLMFALNLAGFLFCWWARIHLGRLWSGSVTLKPDHKVVDTGPYRLVRHPIYTGLLLASLATAVEKATITALVGFVVMLFGIWLKARLEERFLRAELGREAYDAYAARTPMLVPTRL